MSDSTSDRRRRRWDDPADHVVPRSSASPPPRSPSPSSSNVSASVPPVNVEEAKRLAAQRAAELAMKLQNQTQTNTISTTPPTIPTETIDVTIETTTSNEVASTIIHEPSTPPGVISSHRHTTTAGFTQDLDINDCRNRYMLTKAQTQQDIRRETGCEITTRGQYLPDRAQATAARPPLHLHLSATTREALDAAVTKIKELMDRPVDPALLERASFAPRFDRGDAEDTRTERPGPPAALTEKVYIEFGANDRRFNIRAKVVGPKGAYVKHIQNATGVRIQLKGQGSGYTETATGRESDEPLHVFLWTNMGEKALEKAKDLLADLLSQVRADYEKYAEAAARAREAPPMPPMGAMPTGYPMGVGMVAGNPLDPYRSMDPMVTNDRDRDRPSMSQHPGNDSLSSYPTMMGNGYAMAKPTMAYGTGVEANAVIPSIDPTPHYLYQPPYAAPEPPKHIVKTPNDQLTYTRYYAMFYAYYYQLAASGQALPMVQVPPPPPPSSGEDVETASNKASGTVINTESTTDTNTVDNNIVTTTASSIPDAAPAAPGDTPNESTVSNEPIDGTNASGDGATSTTDMDPATAAQWAQYYQYQQYYAAMQAASETNSGNTITSVEITTTTNNSTDNVAGNNGDTNTETTINTTEDDSIGNNPSSADAQAQWAAYYAQYYASTSDANIKTDSSTPTISDPTSTATTTTQ